MSDTVISLSDFKARARQVLESIEESGRPIVLTQHGEAKAVVQDYASFSRTRDAMLMLKLMVQGERTSEQRTSLRARRCLHRCEID